MAAVIRPSTPPPAPKPAAAEPEPAPEPARKGRKGKPKFVNVNISVFETGQVFTEDELPEDHHPMEHFLAVGACTEWR